METSTVRVLVVEDFEPFRRFISSTLANNTDLQIICEVSDGLEGVHKAEELQPDLILLDLGLPTLHGIAAAQRIRELSPKSKILFVSQESSTDVVQEALATGASGYVFKTDAGSELLIAVNAVLHGEIFVSGRFAGHDFIKASSARTAEGLPNKSIFAPRTHGTQIARRHEAGFYSDDRYLLDALTQFIGAALKAGNAAVVVATESHRNSLLPRLQAHGSDIRAAVEQGRYMSWDAAEALSTFMVNRMPDPVRFVDLFGNFIATVAKAAKREHARVAVFGEAVHLLWAQGNAEGAIQVERLADQLTRIYDVDILCGYSLSAVQGGMDSHILQRVCAEHSAVHSR